MDPALCVLTEVQLTSIGLAELKGPVDWLVAIWEAVLGKPLIDLPEGEQITPWDHALPEEQSARILRLETLKSHLGVKELPNQWSFWGLWLNNGPSSMRVAA